MNSALGVGGTPNTKLARSEIETIEIFVAPRVPTPPSIHFKRIMCARVVGFWLWTNFEGLPQIREDALLRPIIE